MKRAVLVGAGHAHLYTIKRAAEFVRYGFEVVLIAPEPFWYSGLATGMLGGFYEPALDQIDAGALLEKGGGRWLRRSVTEVCAAENCVRLADGETLGYDVLSLNVGSVGAPLTGSNEHVFEIKPLANFASLRAALETSTGTPRIAVAGAGASGCEIAANICALLKRHGRRGAVTLLCADAEPVSGMPPRVRTKLAAILRTLGVQIQTHARVAAVRGNSFELSDGRSIPFDFAINATGLKPPAFLRASGLPVDETGALRVDENLRSTAHENVFGGGDCIALAERRIDKVGVYAIREAPILHRNLLATLQGAALSDFHPQKRYLQILNLGDGSGLATWGKWSWHSRLAFRWKDWLDRRFLAEYRGGPAPGG